MSASETPEFPIVAATVPKVRPSKYKHRHKWPGAWRLWVSFTDFIYRVWPRS